MLLSPNGDFVLDPTIVYLKYLVIRLFSSSFLRLCLSFHYKKKFFGAFTFMILNISCCEAMLNLSFRQHFYVYRLYVFLKSLSSLHYSLLSCIKFLVQEWGTLMDQCIDFCGRRKMWAQQYVWLLCTNFSVYEYTVNGNWFNVGMLSINIVWIFSKLKKIASGGKFCDPLAWRWLC